MQPDRLAIIAVIGALGGITIAQGIAQRANENALRAELVDARKAVDRSAEQVHALSERVAVLEEQSRALEVVHAVREARPLLPEDVPAPRPTPAPAQMQAPSPIVAAAVPAPAFLNVNSIPPSTALLDGRMLGPTPQLHVQVAPGRHVVQFVTASGATTMPVSVAAGETKTAAAKLDTPAPAAVATTPEGF